MQVVTSENFQQLVQTGKVDEYKPPEAPKADAKAVDLPTKESIADREQPRGEDGKFVAKDTEVKADKVEEAAKAAVDDDDEDADLPERVKRQIGKKHRAMKEAEEYARELRADREAERARADRAEAALKAAQGEKSGPAAVEKDPKEPKAADFETVGEYAEALAEYKVEKKFAEREAKQAQERQEAAARAAQDALNKRIAETVKDIPDYAEVINESDLDLPPHMAVYIAESPLGPKIGYHLAKNSEDFDRIAKLSPIRAIAELGKLETKLEKGTEAAPAKDAPAVASTSRAPAPITPLDASAKAVVQKDPSKMSLQELREYDRQQRLAKAR